MWLCTLQPTWCTCTHLSATTTLGGPLTRCHQRCTTVGEQRHPWPRTRAYTVTVLVFAVCWLCVSDQSLVCCRTVPKYTPEHWRDVGKGCVFALLDLEGANPWSRLPRSQFKSLQGALDNTERLVGLEVPYRGQRREKIRRAGAGSGSGRARSGGKKTSPRAGRGGRKPLVRRMSSAKRKTGAAKSMAGKAPASAAASASSAATASCAADGAGATTTPVSRSVRLPKASSSSSTASAGSRAGAAPARMPLSRVDSGRAGKPALPRVASSSSKQDPNNSRFGFHVRGASDGALQPRPPRKQGPAARLGVEAPGSRIPVLQQRPSPPR